MAVLNAAVINTITWSLAHIIIFSTDINVNYVAIGLAIGEAVAFHKVLECDWKRAIIMSLIVNSLSFYLTQFILIDMDIFQLKP
ncbi:MAG: hypothetical protein ABI760_18860 [Ferruginibacter sp.]